MAKKKKKIKELIAVVKSLPRKKKRRIWKNWWKNRRNEIEGDTRLEKRRNWRNLWKQLRLVN